MSDDSKKYTLPEIIEEIRKEEMKKTLAEEFDKSVVKKGNSIDDCIKELEKIHRAMKIGAGLETGSEYNKYKKFEKFMKERYMKNYRAKFDLIVEYYDNEKGVNLGKYKEGKDYKFPEAWKDIIKKDLINGKANINNTNNIEEKFNEKINDLNKIITDTQKTTGDYISNKDLLTTLEEAYSSKIEYERTKSKDYDELQDFLRDYKVSLLEKDDEAFQKIEDLVGFMISTSFVRKRLFEELENETDRYLKSIINNITRIPPAAGLELLLEFKKDLINLLKKYDLETKLFNNKISEFPSEEEIAQYQNKEYGNKLMKILKKID